jgi:hypothetical protein
MDEHDIFQEMRSVFRTPMGYDDRFRFTILQTSGGDSKSLMVPELSSSYKWTASAIAGRNAKVPIYVLAEDELQLCTDKEDSEDEEDVDNSDGDFKHGSNSAELPDAPKTKQQSNQSKVVIQKVKPEPGGTQSSQPETSRWSACSAYM